MCVSVCVSLPLSASLCLSLSLPLSASLCLYLSLSLSLSLSASLCLSLSLSASLWPVFSPRLESNHGGQKLNQVTRLNQVTTSQISFCLSCRVPVCFMKPGLENFKRQPKQPTTLACPCKAKEKQKVFLWSSLLFWVGMMRAWVCVVCCVSV